MEENIPPLVETSIGLKRQVNKAKSPDLRINVKTDINKLPDATRSKLRRMLEAELSRIPGAPTDWATLFIVNTIRSSFGKAPWGEEGSGV